MWDLRSPMATELLCAWHGALRGSFTSRPLVFRTLVMRSAVLVDGTEKGVITPFLSRDTRISRLKAGRRQKGLILIKN